MMLTVIVVERSRKHRIDANIIYIAYIHMLVCCVDLQNPVVVVYIQKWGRSMMLYSVLHLQQIFADKPSNLVLPTSLFYKVFC